MNTSLHNLTKRVSNEIKETVGDVRESEQVFEARAVFRWLRRRWKRKYVNQIEHVEVVKHVKTEGRMTSRYSFMICMSCAIATLGLLLSSPAVVIGAMLISPLMSPIMSLGVSLCVLDIRQLKKALEAIVCGVILALLMSYLIVSFSPLTDATPEILARTQPNFFDLLVAIFSGLAGGYAVVKRKGESIVGVAIATALMPPLAVVGFGLATSSMPIAQGAFMLFMTNLLAISLTVTAIAKFYGFGTDHSAKHTAWQMGLIILVFGALSFPLGVALKDIAYQTYVTKTAKSTIKGYFGKERVRLSVFNIRFSKEDGPNIDAVVLTPDYRAKAQPDVRKLLEEKVGGGVILSLDQVVVTKDSIASIEPKIESQNVIASALQPQLVAVDRTQEMTEKLTQSVFFPTEYIKVDMDSKFAAIYPKRAKGVSLASLHQFEISLSQRYPDWTITVVPYTQALPHIYFNTGNLEPMGTQKDKLEDIIWALQRWNASEVKVVGFASTVGEFNRFDNTSLAYRRANNVLQQLTAAGIDARSHAEYRSYKQRDDERQYGINSFQRVEVRLVQTKEPAPMIKETAEEEAPELLPDNEAASEVEESTDSETSSDVVEPGSPR